MVYYFVLFPAVFRGLSCSPRPICRFVLFPRPSLSCFRGIPWFVLFPPPLIFLCPRYSVVCLVPPGLYVGLSCSLRPSLSCVRGIPWFVLFCSPAYMSVCPVPFAPQCPVSASFASGFVLRSLAPHCMRVFFLGSYAGFNPAYCVSVY